jgi:hypothetical protein
MILLNFSHPLTPEQAAGIEQITGQGVARLIDVPTQFEHGQPFGPQVSALLDSAGLTSVEWQTETLLLNLPSLSVIAALVLAEAHGRCGYFPPALRLRPVWGAIPPRFEVAEILDLQGARDARRALRSLQGVL